MGFEYSEVTSPLQKHKIHLSQWSSLRLNCHLFLSCSLRATIARARPDLVRANPEDRPIPEEAPPNYFDKLVDNIEGIGQPTNACFFTMTNVNPEKWYVHQSLFVVQAFQLKCSSHPEKIYFVRWMFEKYDGVRGFWNPVKRVFYSRKGKPLTLPQEIIDSMPNDLFLDGELW